MKKLAVEGFAAFQKAIADLGADYKGNIIIQFSGSKNEKGNLALKDCELVSKQLYLIYLTGESWCPDCVTADPVIQAAVSARADRSEDVFIYVGVGDRTFWKDPNCVFRTDASTKLTSVPTLVKWGTPQRLGESDCSNKNLVEMLFDED